MNETFYIIVPIPNVALSPNFTVGSIGGRMMKAAASKKYRKSVCDAIKNECIESIPWKKVSVKAEFYHKTNRRHDEDNSIGSLKAAYDGIVDAGVVVDDDHTHMRREIPEFNFDKEYPRVVLTITRLE